LLKLDIGLLRVKECKNRNQIKNLKYYQTTQLYSKRYLSKLNLINEKSNKEKDTILDDFSKTKRLISKYNE
jgi:hypothetical protein